MPAMHSISIDKSRNSRKSSSVGGLKRGAVLMQIWGSCKVQPFQLWCKEGIRATRQAEQFNYEVDEVLRAERVEKITMSRIDSDWPFSV